ncbi:DUF1589 domain-containing protein [Rhodopirellula europaea]|uniref:DUF1589 domain-containing protein n=1 Tax=Rhodopirellula europaea TaxID=1263866 RepID=UPI0036F363BD
MTPVAGFARIRIPPSRTSEFWRIQLPRHQRRPGYHLAPSRCFGTKRVVQPLPQDPKTTVQPPRQAQPGLRTPPS